MPEDACFQTEKVVHASTATTQPSTSTISSGSVIDSLTIHDDSEERRQATEYSKRASDLQVRARARGLRREANGTIALKGIGLSGERMLELKDGKDISDNVVNIMMEVLDTPTLRCFPTDVFKRFDRMTDASFEGYMYWKLAAIDQSSFE